ncbi:hypothetical protein ACHQM5_024686 [Ranunculus cassubicifolius]
MDSCSEGKEGDWECGSCWNRNYAFRSLCNRCKQARVVVDNKTPSDSKWLPRIGDWICTGCSNNNYASREKCKKCTQPKELAAMPPLAMLKMNMGMPGANSSGVSYPNNTTQLLIPQGWRSGDWICNCGFHNYSSRTECKKCNSTLPPRTLSSMTNANVAELLPTHGTKRLASEECLGEWDNKRLNAGDVNNFMASQQHSYHGYQQIERTSNTQASGLYSYPGGSSVISLNSQFQMQLPQLAPVPTLLGKGAKQWRDGDWMCTSCNNHNYASRAQCNRCKTERDVGLNQSSDLAA